MKLAKRFLTTLKNIKFNRVIQILYPLFTYYILYNFSFVVFELLFEESMGQLFCLMLSGIVCIIPEYIIFKNSPKLIPDKLTKEEFFRDSLMVLITVLIGILLNIFLTQSGIIENSNNFSQATSVLTDGSIFIKIACNCLVIPILEELLYRGIIAGQLCLWHGTFLATVFSAFCFGILHFNIVQFLYALIVGLALGFMYCKSKRLIFCIFAHGLINLCAIIFS